MIKDKLQIFLITYNREQELKSTFEQIFAPKSPIRDFDITIIDNASTDGTNNLIIEYKKNFPNIKHIMNPINIGGNANICRAFEMASACKKEYAWILCDDDLYNFANWAEVEQNIEANKDIICVSDYAFPAEKYKKNKAYQIIQLAFVPACIFKTKLIDESTMFNMYESTYTMFPQAVLPIKVINNDGEIHVLSCPIVFNGTFFNTKVKNISYIRGYNKSSVTERKKMTCWILGFSNIITLLNDKELIKDCVEFGIPGRDIYGSWERFYGDLCHRYLNIENFNYFYEIYKLLRLKRKIGFWIYFILKDIPGIRHLYSRLKNLSVVMKIRLHNILKH